LHNGEGVCAETTWLIFMKFGFWKSTPKIVCEFNFGEYYSNMLYTEPNLNFNKLLKKGLSYKYSIIINIWHKS
jgi:hypothetical protein